MQKKNKNMDVQLKRSGSTIKKNKKEIEAELEKTSWLTEEPKELSWKNKRNFLSGLTLISSDILKV